MNLQSLNERPRLAMALQLALLVLVFHGIVATTPSSAPGFVPATATHAVEVSPRSPSL
jgi:hypothetical protein